MTGMEDRLYSLLNPACQFPHLNSLPQVVEGANDSLSKVGVI
jgi:hypothetical protein